MSVILNVYAFLGQRSKAVSFLRNIITFFFFFCGQIYFHLCCSCWTFNSPPKLTYFKTDWLPARTETRFGSVQAFRLPPTPPPQCNRISRFRPTRSIPDACLGSSFSSAASYSGMFPPVPSAILLLIFHIRHIPRHLQKIRLQFDLCFVITQIKLYAFEGYGFFFLFKNPSLE